MVAVCLHQPNFIPWTKLMAKIVASDVYVVYDTVQFTRTEYHNRQWIRARNGPMLLSVPVCNARHRQRLCDVRLVQNDDWRGYHLRILKQEYCRSPFFGDVFPLVAEVYRQPHTMLVDFNTDMMATLFQYLEFRTKIVKASELSHHGDNTDRLIQLTAAVGGDEHITSTWGTDREYIDWARVADAGLKVRTQEFTHPRYRQQFEPFVAHLGVLDLIFAQGRAASETIARSSHFPHALTD